MKKKHLNRILLITLSLLFFSTIQISWANQQKSSDELADTSITLISDSKTAPVAVCSLKSMMTCTIILNINIPAASGILKITNNSSFITAYNIDAILPGSLVNDVTKSRDGCDIVQPHSLCTITFWPSAFAPAAIPPQPVPITGTNIQPTIFYLGTTF